jgi:hypothetical protein
MLTKFVVLIILVSCSAGIEISAFWLIKIGKQSEQSIQVKIGSFLSLLGFAFTVLGGLGLYFL